MKTIRDITPEDVQWVNDLLVYENRMLLLGSSLTDKGTYLVKVLEMKDDSFTALAQFESQYVPMSFEYDGTAFYVATGDKDAVTRIDNFIKIIPCSI